MKKLRKITPYIPIYLVGILLAFFLWQQPIILAFCYLGLTIVMFILTRSKADISFYLLSATLGPLAEFIIIQNGAWSYTRPSFFIPIWLPFAWGIAGLVIKKTSETLAS